MLGIDSGYRSAERILLAERGGLPLVFRLSRHWGQILKRLHIKGGDSQLIAVPSLMCLPLLLLTVRYWPYRPLSAFWAVWLTVCDSVIILLSWHTWNAFMEAGSVVEDMLEGTPQAQLHELQDWYQRAFRARPQLLVCSAAALLTLGGALRLPSPIVERVPVSIASLLVSGFVVGHAFYFIIYTGLFCRKISGMSNLRLTWNAPIDTPGLFTLSRATQLEAQVGMIMFFVVAVPLTYAYIKVHDSGTRLIYLGEMLLPLLSILSIGLVIQGWLAVPVRRFKRITLKEFSASIDTLRAGRTVDLLQAEDLTKIKDRLEVYQLLNGIPDSFLRGGIITQYLSSIGAATIPFVVAFLLRK